VDSKQGEDENLLNESSSATSSSSSSSSSSYSSSSSSISSGNDEESSSTKFTLRRVGYSTIDFFDSESPSILNYAFLANYSAVIEPWASMELVYYGSSGSSSSSSSSVYSYKVCPVSSNSESDCASGVYDSNDSSKSTYVKVECSSWDEYSFTVSSYAISTDEDPQDSYSGYAICMYVRREIRDLTTEDLIATMDAMFTLWSTKEEDGQEKYGENFHNSTYFTSAHDFNAAWQDADHIHEGLGFIPQHIKITNMFELSMQAVNPSISLPFWDFTIDNSENITIFESFMFTNETFGTLPSPKDHKWGWTYSGDNINDASIPDGRWAYQPADINYAFPELQNGFGYIRGPWNMNPSPYLVRFPAYDLDLPSCRDYFAWAGDTDLVDFLEIAAYGPHASTHGVVGGNYGCDYMDDLLADGLIMDESSQIAICKKWGFYLKELYRANYISPRTDCTAGSTMRAGKIDCGFTCNTDQYDDFTTELRTVISPDYVPTSLSETDWEKWRDFICEGDGYRIFVGDHLESASPSDPSFWPIHPTQERLLQAKFLSGAWAEYKWPADSLANYICDKPSCYEADYGKKDYFAECCYGHYEFDQLLDFTSGNKSQGYGPTNHDIFKAINGLSSYSMPYIYSGFQWAHCTEDDFDSLFSGQGGDPDIMGSDTEKATPDELDGEGEISSSATRGDSSRKSSSKSVSKKKSNDERR